MPARTTIREWMGEYNRLAGIAQARGIRIRPYANLRVSNSEAERRVRNLASQLNETVALGAISTGSTPAAPVSPPAYTFQSPRPPRARSRRRSVFGSPPAPHLDDNLIPQVGSGLTIDDFTFGAEFEFTVPSQISMAEIARRLTEGGVQAYAAGYSHSRSSQWKVVTDGSLNSGVGRTAFELVSPPLAGVEGIEQVEKACDILTAIGANVNRSCGLHVHIGVKREINNVNFFRNICNLYDQNEQHIDSILAPSRRGSTNSYCQPFRSEDRTRINRAQTVNDIVGTQHSFNRYMKLNLQSYWRHRTIEFRQHQGTVDKTKAVAWIRLCLRMTATAAAGERIGRATDLVSFLLGVNANPDEVGYFTNRYAHFHQGTSNEV